MNALEELAALVRRESGIVVKPSQLGSLAAAVTRAAPDHDPARMLAALSDSGRRAELLDRLVDEVSIKETYFLRNERELTAIEWPEIWDVARRGGRSSVRVWSAACATGEEAYTLALLACEAFGSAAPPVTVLGTDLSRTALKQAQQGEYRSRALQNVSQARRDRWFRPSGSALAVGDELRRIVRWRRHNLVRDPIPPPDEARFDLIVCRNVLIYFDSATVHSIVNGIQAALQPEGILVIGAADRLSVPVAASTRIRTAGSTKTPRTERKRPPAPPRRLPRRDPAPAGATARPAPEGPSGALERALAAVHSWSLEETLARTAELIEREPLNVDAQFVRGVAQLAAGDPQGAVSSLRMALYLDPSFGLAAFKLARAHEATGDLRAARNAYLRALHSLNPDDPRNTSLLEQLDVADIAIACRDRLAKLDERP
jgi:chemotaxis protein methyltransferase CheR